MQVIQPYISQVNKLCESHFVRTLYVFGSASADTMTHESDVDLLVDFKNVSLNDYADNYFDLKFSLENLFNRPVDLLEEKALHNPYLIKSINRSKKLVYG